MARKHSRNLPMAIGMPEPEPEPYRPIGPLLSDGDPYRRDPLKGGEIYCSGVMRGRGMSNEHHGVDTVSAYGLRYRDPYRERREAEDEGDE